jgi:hypothetical protein
MPSNKIMGVVLHLISCVLPLIRLCECSSLILIVYECYFVAEKSL